MSWRGVGRRLFNTNFLKWVHPIEIFMSCWARELTTTVCIKVGDCGLGQSGAVTVIDLLQTIYELWILEIF